jgi:hypothetical protein
MWKVFKLACLLNVIFSTRVPLCTWNNAQSCIWGLLSPVKLESCTTTSVWDIKPKKKKNCETHWFCELYIVECLNKFIIEENDHNLFNSDIFPYILQPNEGCVPWPIINIFSFKNAISLCYVPCKLNWIEIENLSNVWVNSILNLISCFLPFSDLLCYISHFWQPQIVLKIEKKISWLCYRRQKASLTRQ